MYPEPSGDTNENECSQQGGQDQQIRHLVRQKAINCETNEQRGESGQRRLEEREQPGYANGTFELSQQRSNGEPFVLEGMAVHPRDD